MKGPHICDCLCSLCEHLGAGAFGPQPDGSAGICIVPRRRVRRQRYSLYYPRYPMLLRRGIRSFVHL